MERLNIKKKINKYFFIIVISILLIFGCLCLLVYKNQVNKQTETTENNSVENYINENLSLNDEQNKNDVFEKTEKVNYKAVLEIPKINLKRGLVDKYSKENNINKNIYVLRETNYPNTDDYSHIYLASHSGNSSVSYFKNLVNLSNDDIINLYYKDKIYTYEIYNKYEIEKTGVITINVIDENNITLITCLRDTNKQLVIVARLVNIQERGTENE